MQEIEIVDEILPDVFRLKQKHTDDNRGTFTKLFHSDSLCSQGLNFELKELFITKSKRGVLRGMHFQEGVAAHAKLVTCLRGKVLDVIVNIRKDSIHFNKPKCIELCEQDDTILLIGKDYAHGFLSLTDDSWLLYSTSTVHNPSLDKGIHWKSIDFDWPIDKPLISYRDSKHPSINDYQ